jgi:hypothetical protein
MSYVTSVTIVMDYATPEFEAAVTAPHRFRADTEWQDSFARINTDEAGGSKIPSHDVFAAGLNYCERDWLRAWADGLPWQSWGVVVVDTEGDAPEVWTYGVSATRSVRPGLPELAS